MIRRGGFIVRFTGTRMIPAFILHNRDDSAVTALMKLDYSRSVRRDEAAFVALTSTALLHPNIFLALQLLLLMLI